MFFFKSKQQRNMEREIKRVGEWLTSQAAIKIFAGQYLREHRDAFEKEQGGLAGFLNSPIDQQSNYIFKLVEQMKAAEAEGDECRFACANLFAMFLDCYARGFNSSAVKAIGYMERVQRLI